MYSNEYEFSQFYEIAVKKLLDEGLDKKAADSSTLFSETKIKQRI
jgi:hypothetical protein